ncbi:CPBP family intramembrane metalloprotease, partial [Clostridioides difficile]|nr:CPBP family intramembrane metalloprotease [Clostridioides difficile]
MNLSYVKKYFINFCIAILISLLIAFVYFITSAFQSINSAIQNQMIKTISTFIISFIIVVILAKMYNESIVENTYKKLSLKSFFKYNKYDKKHISTILSLLMVSIIFAIGTSIFISKLTEGYGSDSNSGMITFIAAFTYVPFLEELIFRGLFFNIASSLLDMKNPIVKNIAVVANIILFLTMHYSSCGFPIFNIPLSLLISILPRIVISASMVYIYIETRDIKYNIFLHMIYN